MHSFRLRRPCGTLPIGPRINGFRLNAGDTFAVLQTRLPRLGGSRAGRWTVSSMLRKMQHVKCILRATSDGKPVCTGFDPAAARSQTGGGLCVFYR